MSTGANGPLRIEKCPTELPTIQFQIQFRILRQNKIITENKEIPDNSLVIGAPGKVVREITEEEKKAVFENTKHYQDNWKKYSKSIF